MGCNISGADATFNYGMGILGCYNCDLTYPRNVTVDDCKVWSPQAYTSSAYELAQAVMHDSEITLTDNIFLDEQRPIALLSYVGGARPLTGLVIDGQGAYKVDGRHESRCFLIDNAGSEVTLKGLTVMNCQVNALSYAPDISDSRASGAGVWAGVKTKVKRQRTCCKIS